MNKITKAFELTNVLIKAGLLTGAKAKVVNPNDFLDSNLLTDFDEAVLVEQQYTVGLTEKASKMYMVVVYNSKFKGYRVHHELGFSAVHKYKCLGAMMAGHWQARRTELIYNDNWRK